MTLFQKAILAFIALCFTISMISIGLKFIFWGLSLTIFGGVIVALIIELFKPKK